MSLPWIHSGGWSCWSATPILSCAGCRTSQEDVVMATTENTTKSVENFSRQLPPVQSLRKYFLPPEQNTKNDRKRHPPHILYIFFCTFIYRLIYSNRFFSSFRAFPVDWVGFLTASKMTTDREQRCRVENCTVFFFCFCFFVFLHFL